MQSTCNANDKEHILLEITEHGGHVGFMIPNSRKTYAEKRALEFAN
jgi:predicted alpha/beta-fold hydrolase